MFINAYNIQIQFLYFVLQHTIGAYNLYNILKRITYMSYIDELDLYR